VPRQQPAHAALALYCAKLRAGVKGGAQTGPRDVAEREQSSLAWFCLHEGEEPAAINDRHALVLAEIQEVAILADEVNRRGSNGSGEKLIVVTVT
jgi:hypothetical protein